jgi:DNA-binding transcriptional ArsR family regulator
MRTREGSGVFSAISDPTRRAMLDALVAGPRPAGELVSLFPQLTQPSVSRHLRVLREADLVSVTFQAQQRIYKLNPEGLRELHDWISKYRMFWADRIDSLASHLDGERFIH